MEGKGKEGVFCFSFGAHDQGCSWRSVENKSCQKKSDQTLEIAFFIELMIASTTRNVVSGRC